MSAVRIDVKNRANPVPRVLGVRWRDRLFLRVYLALLAGLLLVGAALWGVSYYVVGQREGAALEAYAETASRLLPPASAPVEEQTRVLQSWNQRVGAQLTLYTADGQLIAHVGDVLPPPKDLNGHSTWIRRDGGIVALRLTDGRWLLSQRDNLVAFHPFRLAAILACIALAVSLGAYPVARGLTRRLETLQVSVEALGSGDWKARVDERGNDEIARLAKSFNQAAARIESVVKSQKALLANASHELRSPLARIRMAVELAALSREDDAQDIRRKNIADELRKNVVELDELIDEILLASRLEANAIGPALEDVDFTALVAEECARVGAQLHGTQAELRGDSRMLRRLVRNLLENGLRHGGGPPLEVELHSPSQTLVRMQVLDRGPGIPEDLRERVFEPFFRAPGSRESDGGVGLGLALVRSIAAYHRGSVQCDSRPGGGSVFSLVLPIG